MTISDSKKLKFQKLENIESKVCKIRIYSCQTNRENEPRLFL